MKIAWIGNYKGAESDGHTGHHQAIALKELGYEVDFYDWRELNTIKKKYDLYYNTDSSDYYELPEKFKPLVFWCGDIQIDAGANGWRVKRALEADVTVTPNIKAGLEILRGYGVEPLVVHWGYSKNWCGEKAPSIAGRPYDVEMLGNPTCTERTEIWKLLAHLDDIGSKTGKVYGTEFKRIMTNSKIGIQNNSMPHNDHYPNRPLEIMASGQLLIKQRLTTDEFDYFFTENEDFLYYDDVTDLVGKIYWYLRHDAKRMEIATSGYQKALKHEYQYKMAEMMSQVTTKLYGKI